MDNSILNWTLKIVIYMSAALSVCKPKNNIVHLILECIYSVLISALPVVFLSVLIWVFNERGSVNIGIVIEIVSFLVVGPLVYFIISNRKEEKKIEDYFLVGALYIDEYRNGKKQIKKYKCILALEVIHFLLLFFSILFGMASLMSVLGILTIDTFMIAFVIGLFIAYGLFVYSKCEKEIRQRRKAILNIFISLVWLVVVCIRINHYWKDTTLIGLEDMLILFFSAVFTIPTIYVWMKNIPARLIEPHSKRVYERRNEIVKECSEKKEECKKFGVYLLDELKECIKFIIIKWKNGEKKKIVKFFFCIFMIVAVWFVIIWLENNLTILMGEVIQSVKAWYANLNYEMQEGINDILVFLFIFAIMVWGVFTVPSNYATKENRVEKVKYVVSLIIFEILFGYLAVTILFF